MGCGASSKKYEDKKKDGAEKKDEAEKTDKREEDDGGVKATVIDAALDVVGFAGATVGGAASMVGHGIATVGLTIADCATLGMIDSIGNARDEQYEQMIDGRDDAAAGFNCHSNTDFYRGEAPCDLSDWMSTIPDDTKITAMWLPGTHDTLADNGGDLAECQSWTLKQQLESGIRVLDLRLKHDCDKLCCYHGIIDLHHGFPGVVADIEEFLTQHPTEAIFARMKREGSCGEHAREFHDEVVAELTKPELWNFKNSSWTCLSDYRGKVTFLAWCSHLLLYKQLIDVQDDYKQADETKKFDVIMAHVSKEKAPDTLSVCMCSCVGLEGWTCYKPPGVLAYQVNKMVLDADDKLTPGCYIFDFPGKSSVKAIIAHHQHAS
mmetsp:Transcript_49913/g.93560  ORF Transcript_49913/g.93560 Transcript_49913/m.93560 type:complete len:378 (-) Transcript_49913:70-1203(-)